MNEQSRILVVDDMPTNLFYFSEILGDDYDVETADCGEAGYDMVTEFKPEIVFLDVMMPDIDGFEVCRRIRSSPDLSDTRVVMVSARGSTEDRLLGYDAGADDYITKPFNEEELRRKLSAYLRVKPAAELSRLKSDVAMLFNHETRTPLNGIIAPLEMLMQDNGQMPNEERSSLLAIMHRSVTRLIGFTDKSLLVTDLLRGDHRVNRETLDIADVMQKAFDAEISEANEKAIAFRFIPRHGGDVVTGKRELEFVIRAVLNNAVKVSSEGSAIEVSTFTENGVHKIAILDTGRGLPEEMREHVFEPFGRAHCSRYADGQSLSLFVCRKFLEMQGGTIDLHNHPSGGAICEITLPVQASATAATQDGPGSTREQSCRSD